MKTYDFSFTVESSYIHKLGLNGLDLLMYCLLKKYTGMNGGFSGSTKVLAEQLNIAYTTAQRIINSLVICGLIRIDPSVDNDGHKLRTITVIK